MDKDPGMTPDPSEIEAIKKANNLAIRDKIREVLLAFDTKRGQTLNRGAGTITQTRERTLDPNLIPSLHDEGYSEVAFSRVRDLGATGTIPPDVMGVEATESGSGIKDVYIILDFGKDHSGQEHIVLCMEDEDSHLPLGFSKETGEPTTDVEDYSRSQNFPDGFIPGAREMTDDERKQLNSIIAMCSRSE